jgi:hypothetical protein
MSPYLSSGYLWEEQEVAAINSNGLIFFIVNPSNSFKCGLGATPASDLAVGG